MIIPTHNSQKCLPDLLDSLSRQSVRPDEIIIVDDYSTDRTKETALRYGVIFLENKGAAGPASARNSGIRASKGDILAFIDSDCIADDAWIGNIIKKFSFPGDKVVMGRVIIPKSTFLGDAISALGFPAGGHLGFDKMWHVDKDGRTDHMGSGNCAMRKETILKVGLFDETFPYPGNEDVEFSVRCVNAGIPIYYQDDVIVTHPPRKDMASFIKWQFVRGKANYHLKKRLKRIGSFIKLRIWSAQNIIRKYKFDLKLPLILFLLALAFMLQQAGYVYEKQRDNRSSP